MPRVIVFDVNETLLDVKALAPHFVRVFGDAREPYHHAARDLGVEPAGMRFVAAHAWDVYGAMRAGCAGAFDARPGQTLSPLAPPPDIVGRDLREVAERIIATESQSG